MENYFVNIMESRKQIREFDNKKVPDESVIEEIINQTFALVPSKQKLMPYTVHVLGPKHEDLKDNLYKMTMKHEGRRKEEYYKVGNRQLLAPYVLLFERRIPRSNNFVNELQNKGRNFNYDLGMKNSHAPIECGMFITILTGLCIIKGLSISYTSCMPDVGEDKNGFVDSGIPFIKHPVLTMVSIGYPDYAVPEEALYARNTNIGEQKPNIDEVIKWHD